MNLTMGMWILIGGALVGVLGALFLITGGKMGKTIAGILLLVIGLSAAKVGYDLDQTTEVQYTVTEVTAVTAKATDNNYRITIKDASGVETWIYVKEDNLYRFPKDEVVTMTKEQVKRYSVQE